MIENIANLSKSELDLLTSLYHPYGKFTSLKDSLPIRASVSEIEKRLFICLSDQLSRKWAHFGEIIQKVVSQIMGNALTKTKFVQI